MSTNAFPPSYREVAESLIQRIDSGEYPPGTQLPSTAMIAEEFGVTESTAYRAVRYLAELGRVVTRQGRGVYVVG